MTERYQIREYEYPLDRQSIAEILSKEGQLVLPMVELVEQAQCAVDEVIDVMGHATIEAILQMSAEQSWPVRSNRASDLQSRL